jgi:hypothetical protein
MGHVAAYFYGLIWTLLLLVPSTHALEIAAVGAVEATYPEFQPENNGVGPSPAIGYGGLLAQKFGDVELETGVLRLPYRLEEIPLLSTTRLLLTFPYAQVPLVLRYKLSQEFFVGLGGYYAVYAGGGQLEIKNDTSTIRSDADPVDAGRREYGLVANLRLRLAIEKHINFIVDGRYLYGLKNMADPGDSQKVFYRHLQFLFGLGFSF